MPMYQYKAVSPSGEIKEGVVEGATQAGVIAHLQSTGLIPIRAAEVLAGGIATTPGTSEGSTPRKALRAANAQTSSAGHGAVAAGGARRAVGAA